MVLWYNILLDDIKRYGFIDISAYTLCQTDIYLFCRMFTKFDMDKMSRSPRGCENTPIPKNVIVYGGNLHIVLINELLKSFVGQPLYSFENIGYMAGNHKNCIDFKEKLQFL